MTDAGIDGAGSWMGLADDGGPAMIGPTSAARARRRIPRVHSPLAGARAVALALVALMPAAGWAQEPAPLETEGAIAFGPDVNEDPDQGQPQAGGARAGNTVFDVRAPWADRLALTREQLFERYGLTFGASYQQLAQWASATAPFGTHDTALGGWLDFSTTWTPVDRGGPYQGTLVARVGWRGPIGDNAVPSDLGILDLGSIWGNFEFTTWGGGLKVEDLFWQQRLGDRFSFRVGNVGAQMVYNFFRFKDARESFTTSPLAFNEQMPYPTFGFGGSFRWLPVASDPGIYLVGTVNDMNGVPSERGLDWSTAWDYGQFFYGVEIGRNWTRPNGEFDHVHLDVFYADERSTRSPDMLPNTAGGGFKIAGEKQVGRFVGFGSYLYNTAEGGGISASFARHTVVGGLAYLRPFAIEGEAAIAGMWAQSFPDLVPGVGARDQYGVETYWNMALAENVTLTPGIQLLFDPVFNPTEDFIAIPHIKFRIAF